MVLLVQYEELLVELMALGVEAGGLFAEAETRFEGAVQQLVKDETWFVKAEMFPVKAAPTFAGSMACS